MTGPPYTNPFDWLSPVDDALKAKLSIYEIIVPATGVTIPIPVWFRFPDTEEITRSYPHIAIDMTDIRFESARAQRAVGWIDRQVWNGGGATPQLTTAVADDMPLPWSLIYQLATYTRNPREDRSLQALMMYLFPAEYGWLDMSAIDGTTRRADFISDDRRDTIDENRKRVYRVVTTVAISAEFSLSQINEIVNIRTINLQLDFNIMTPTG